MRQLAAAMNIAIVFLFVGVIAADIARMPEGEHGFIGALLATALWRVLLDVVGED